MIAHVPMLCPYCKKKFNVSESFIDGLLSTMKMNKVLEVAQQMADKRGPFYDRWKAAMDLRGEQMRCATCLGFNDHTRIGGGYFCGYKDKEVNPGQFSCSIYIAFRPD